MINRFWWLFIICFSLITLSACGTETVLLSGSLSSPEVHTENGLKLLSAGKIEGSLREFSMAVELSPNYSRAYEGLSRIHIIRNEFKESFSDISKARAYAKSEEELHLALIGYLRLYAVANDKLSADWLAKAQTVYQEVCGKWKSDPAVHFFMGLAYKNADQFEKAEARFLDVINIDNGYILEADSEYADMQRKKNH